MSLFRKVTLEKMIQEIENTNAGGKKNFSCQIKMRNEGKKKRNRKHLHMALYSLPSR